MADKKISALTAASTPLVGTEVLPIVQSGATVKVSVDNLTTGKAVTVGSMSSSGLITARAGVVGGNFSAVQVDNQSGGSGSPANTVSVNFANGGAVKASITAAVYGDGYMDFATDSNTAKMRITAGGGIINNLGNFVLGTAGRGIDFSANTHGAGMTSELLNDYEEGTWTPTQGGGMVVVGSFASNGTYTKVGRFVFVRGLVTGSTSIAATAGGLFCGGFPFTVDVETVLAVNDAASSASPMLVAGTNIYSVQSITAAPRIVFSAMFVV